PLKKAKQAFREALPSMGAKQTKNVSSVKVSDNGNQYSIGDGSVVIAAITSCTNTSNPSVMLAAGLLAKKAVERGLTVQPWVKTSLAPGSRVVSDYLKETGLMLYLEKLRFHLVGYGCTTCIGNSGPLPEPVASAVKDNGLVVVAVLSGNRNFEGRINPLVRANYLASPPLVVAYALAGTMDIDLETEPLGSDKSGKPVYLRDVWPTQKEVMEAINSSIRAEMFRKAYEESLEGDQRWKVIDAPKDFNSYGARRGNHEVMMRGTFANVRLRNQMAPGTEGGWTVHLPDKTQTTIYEAAMQYRNEGVPLVVLAGKEYGSGSSRDWAAKGPRLLGIEAVIAESFERIHRSNLVGMGVLPLQFRAGENAAAL